MPDRAEFDMPLLKGKDCWIELFIELCHPQIKFPRNKFLRIFVSSKNFFPAKLIAERDDLIISLMWSTVRNLIEKGDVERKVYEKITNILLGRGKIWETPAH